MEADPLTPHGVPPVPRLLIFLALCLQVRPAPHPAAVAAVAPETDFAAWVQSLPPGGRVVLDKPIALKNLRRQEFDFKNVLVLWRGPPDVAMFTLSRCDSVSIKWLRVYAEAPLLSVFDVTSHPPDGAGTRSEERRVGKGCR